MRCDRQQPQCGNTTVALPSTLATMFCLAGRCQRKGLSCTPMIYKRSRATDLDVPESAVTKRQKATGPLAQCTLIPFAANGIRLNDLETWTDIQLTSDPSADTPSFHTASCNVWEFLDSAGRSAYKWLPATFRTASIASHLMSLCAAGSPDVTNQIATQFAFQNNSVINSRSLSSHFRKTLLQLMLVHVEATEEQLVTRGTTHAQKFMVWANCPDRPEHLLAQWSSWVPKNFSCNSKANPAVTQITVMGRVSDYTNDCWGDLFSPINPCESTRTPLFEHVLARIVCPSELPTVITKLLAEEFESTVTNAVLPGFVSWHVQTVVSFKCIDKYQHTFTGLIYLDRIVLCGGAITVSCYECTRIPWPERPDGVPLTDASMLQPHIHSREPDLCQGDLPELHDLLSFLQEPTGLSSTC